MRREHYSMSLSDASEIFQTAKVTQKRNIRFQLIEEVN